MGLLEPQRHLIAARASTTAIRFFWDDWNTETVEEAPDDALVARLRQLSDRAIVALAAGMGEWVVYRFEPLNTDPRPEQFVEAVWAAEVDWRYLWNTWEAVMRSEKWSGPVRGPLGATMMALDDLINVARVGGDLTVGARWVGNIAAHVLPDRDPFMHWRDRALRRLASLYPRNEDDLIGDVVPREVLEVDREFQFAETPALINLFLHRLDYRDHPFLGSPEQLQQAGFARTPYGFDLARDRTERLFW